MRHVIIDMKNNLFADAIRRSLVDFDSDLKPYKTEKPEDTVGLCKLLHPYALIMEVTASAQWSLEERLKTRDTVKADHPDCKVVLMVDENTDKNLAYRVRQAKKDGLIDNFIYGSISTTYLSAVIDTL